MDVFNTTASVPGLNQSLNNDTLAELFTDMDMLYDTFRPSINIIQKYVTPVMYVVGFPGNILAFIVWIQPRMRHSSGVYLAALALTDFVFLILQVLFELHTVWKIPVLNVVGVCEVFPIIFLASQYLSPLLVMGFTIERYISVCHPFQREKYCSVSRAIRVITFLVIFCLCFNAVQGYIWKFYTTNHECSPREEVTVGKFSFWLVWSWITEMLVFLLVPVTILILNLLVIRETRRLQKSEEKRLCLQKGHKATVSSSTTFMLLVVSFYLIFTTLPVTLCYVLYFSFPPGDMGLTIEAVYTDPVWQRHFSFVTVRTIVQEIGLSHFACNFYLYAATGLLFRVELRRLFFKLFSPRKLRDRLWDPDYLEYKATFLRNSPAANGNVTQV